MNRPAVVIPLVLVVCLLGSFGQTLLKLAVNRIPAGATLGSAIGSLLSSGAFYVGGLTVSAGTLTWLFVMSRAELTYATPFLSFAFIITMATSALILHEAQPIGRVVGTVLVVVGMVLVGRS